MKITNRYIPTCYWCNRHIDKGSEFFVDIADYHSICCCRKHSALDLAHGMSEGVAEQIIYDVWDNPDRYYDAVLKELLDMVHARNGGSAKTTNRQFEYAKKFIMNKCMKSKDFADAICDKYIEVYTKEEKQDDYDEDIAYGETEN